MASGKRPPPPPLSQRPASVYPLTSSQPILPPPPAALFVSPFDSPVSQGAYDTNTGSSEALDDYEITPDDAANYYIPTTSADAPVASDPAGALGDPFNEEFGYEDPDNLFNDPFFQEGFDDNFGDPNYATPTEPASTRLPPQPASSPAQVLFPFLWLSLSLCSL